jgi:hypothetical protein
MIPNPASTLWNIRLNLFVGVVFALLASTGQEALAAGEPRDAGRLTVEREKEKEDQVAKQFESIRAGANIPPLQRIGHRADLEQSVCTSALTDTPPKLGFAFYVTADPESVTPELRKIALSNRMDSKRKPWYSRYSVAIWGVHDQQAGTVTYRVGVGLYGSAAGEFVDCHFTDDVHYCGNWKKLIAPSCRGK